MYWTAYAGLNMLGQAHYPFRAAQRIARDRDRNLRRMVRYAYRWVPYYRETFDRIGIEPDAIRTLDDMVKLPLISVRDLQEHPEAFRSEQAQPLLALDSSGSTGAPHTIWHSRSSLYLNAAHAQRRSSLRRQLLGRKSNRRWLVIDAIPGQTLEVQEAMQRYALLPRRAVTKRETIDDDQPLDTLAEEIAARRPDILSGFGATLGELVMRLDAQPGEQYWPPVVSYAVEAMPLAARRVLTRRGVQILSVYQSCEAFKLCWECEAHQGYHVNADWYPMRIVDDHGHDLTTGETGEIVISNLTNHGTVLLNYRTGDLASSLDEPCPCGRNLPRISWVQGRVTEALISATGERVPWWLFARALTEIPGVWQFQVVQDSHERLIVRVMCGPDCDRAKVREVVGKLVAKRLGSAMIATVSFDSDFEYSAAGKLRHVINLVAPDQDR